MLASEEHCFFAFLISEIRDNLKSFGSDGNDWKPYIKTIFFLYFLKRLIKFKICLKLNPEILKKTFLKFFNPSSIIGKLSCSEDEIFKKTFLLKFLQNL